ncbi:hypothetical protein JTB14_020182 [Gonioctena quinquepunctata]|nr:hypothetical protein JTB14_020182 [Gonioctena quinquepunctata]
MNNQNKMLWKTYHIFFYKDNTQYFAERHVEKSHKAQSDEKSTYRGIVGQVTHAVKGNEAVDAIRSIKSTEDGTLLLTHDEDSGALDNLSKALKDAGTFAIKAIGHYWGPDNRSNCKRN